MINGTYTDEEGRVSRLVDIKPCMMFHRWIHATSIREILKGKEWVKERKPVTICMWGNHGVKIEKGQT